jgi:AraC family transcriptional regulator, transcriptional activator of pobA
MAGKLHIIPVYTESESFEDGRIKDFYVSSYEDAEPDYLKRVEPHKHTYYEIIFIVAGKGRHIIDFTEYPFKGPCLFLLQPGHVHQIIKFSQTKGYVVKFSESFLEVSNGVENAHLKNEVFDNIQAKPVVHPDKAMFATLEELVMQMRKEYKRTGDLSRRILISYLTIFLLQIAKAKGCDTDIRVNPRVALFRNFKKLVEECYAREHSVEFYANALHSTVRSLNTLVRENAGRTAKELINDRILLEAKRLLYNGSWTIKEIAFQIGFDDPAYFSRFFSKQAGVSALSFRETALKKAR